MRILLYILGGILIIIWAVGFFLFNAGNTIHLLLIISAFTVMRAFVKDEEPIYIRKDHTWKTQD